MSRVAPLLLGVLLAGCATTPVSLSALRQNPCSTGFVLLYFRDGAETLRPMVGSGLDWPAQAMDECSTVQIKVKGLPSPSADSLPGRRAQTVADALRLFGIARPSFELGDDHDQANPALEITARL
jgi:hypothetical protein